MKWFVPLLCLATLASSANYSGYQVLSVVPQTPRDAYLLRQVVESNTGIQFWTEPRALGVSVDVFIPPHVGGTIKSFLKRKDIAFSVKIDDVQKLIDDEAATLRKSSVQSKKFDHTSYHDLTAIYAILDAVEVDFPSLVTNTVIGTTYEGRPIRQVQVSSGGAGSRPIIFIDCGIHAREWVSPATCLYILDQLTSGYGSDPAVTAIVDAHDFYIVPSANPDGYSYTWSNDRLWRKNRVPFGLCTGVDPNRNFDSGFGGEGTSNTPCSDLYHGPAAFSEAESQAIRDSVNANKSRIKAYFSLHSYSQLWMTPFGYQATLPTNYAEQYRVAGIGVNALTAVHGTPYSYGNIYVTIYPAAGSSVDWVFDATVIQYSFTLELRDLGLFGFTLPPGQILPTGEETWAGISASINAMQ